MTDKQIKEVFKNGFYCIEPCPEIKELQAKLKRKEQECEELKEARKNSRCAWKSLEGTFCPEAQEQLDQLKAKNDELKKIIKRLDVPKHEVIDMDIALENEKLKQTLAEIKEIAETCSFTDNIQLLLNRFEQILQKISKISDGRSPVSEQMTTAVPTARSWNSVSTKKFQDSEVANDR